MLLLAKAFGVVVIIWSAVSYFKGYVSLPSALLFVVAFFLVTAAGAGVRGNLQGGVLRLSFSTILAVILCYLAHLGVNYDPPSISVHIIGKDISAIHLLSVGFLLGFLSENSSRYAARASQDQS